MPEQTIKVPVGFETQISTDTTPENWRDIRGYKAEVTLSGIVVFERYYRNQDSVLLKWAEAHPSPIDADSEVKRQWLTDREKVLKDTAEDDRDAAEKVLEAFAHRLALTLTWPDGA